MDEDAEPMVEGDGPQASGGRRPALVVAYDAAAQEACRSALEAEWDVTLVDSGVAAVIAARKAVPGVIFVDLQLRDVPGAEAVGWLRSNPELGSVPIVLIAGGAEDDAEIAAIHPTALLRKPVSRGAVERVAGSLAG
jgi:CheY-like chemotaxis protein